MSWGKKNKRGKNFPPIGAQIYPNLANSKVVE